MIIQDQRVLNILNPSIDVIGSTARINLNASPLDNLVNEAMKRITDRIFSLLAMILFSPVMLAIAVGVKLSNPGPVFCAGAGGQE